MEFHDVGIEIIGLVLRLFTLKAGGASHYF